MTTHPGGGQRRDVPAVTLVRADRLLVSIVVERSWGWCPLRPGGARASPDGERTALVPGCVNLPEPDLAVEGGIGQDDGGRWIAGRPPGRPR